MLVDFGMIGLGHSKVLEWKERKIFRKSIILKKVFQNFHYLLNCNTIFRLFGEEGDW